MATKKTMARTARKSAKIIAIVAAATGASVQQTSQAADAALRDMQAEFGKGNVYEINYTWDPFDGLYA